MVDNCKRHGAKIAGFRSFDMKSGRSIASPPNLQLPSPDGRSRPRSHQEHQLTLQPYRESKFFNETICATSLKRTIQLKIVPQWFIWLLFNLWPKYGDQQLVIFFIISFQRELTKFESFLFEAFLECAITLQILQVAAQDNHSVHTFHFLELAKGSSAKQEMYKRDICTSQPFSSHEWEDVGKQANLMYR